MMPLRKMRSRSLAVVELVLSLSVSRAWCMAAKHTQEKRKCRFYSTREKNSEHKTGILQCYSISRLRRTEMGAASQLSAFSVLSVSFLFISDCIFLLKIPTFSLLNATCVEDWNATKIPLTPNRKEEMGLDFAAGCSGLRRRWTLIQMQYVER